MSNPNPLEALKQKWRDRATVYRGDFPVDECGLQAAAELDMCASQLDAALSSLQPPREVEGLSGKLSALKTRLHAELSGLELQTMVRAIEVLSSLRGAETPPDDVLIRFDDLVRRLTLPESPLTRDDRATLDDIWLALNGKSPRAGRGAAEPEQPRTLRVVLDELFGSNDLPHAEQAAFLRGLADIIEGKITPIPKPAAREAGTVPPEPPK